MTRQNEMFIKPPRAKPRVMAHVVDAGENVAKFHCKTCGWNSGWVYDDEMNTAQIKRGIPCQQCNEGAKP